MTEESLGDLRAAFAEQGLPAPFVPSELAPEVRRLDPATFGTRPAPQTLYRLQHYEDEVVMARPDDFLLTGFAGHGVASRAMHYYLALGPAAVLLQLPWGGTAVGDDDRARIERCFAAVEVLVEAGRTFSGSDRVVAKVTAWAGSGWLAFDATGVRIDGDSADSDDVLTAAAEWLRSRD